jgi:RND superfamily putative drug exporter
MVAVFSIFATLSLIEFKMFGVAMAAAVLIDATIVRGVLLPAGLALLGDRVWPQKRRGARGAQPAGVTSTPVTGEVAVR